MVLMNTSTVPPIHITTKLVYLVAFLTFGPVLLAQANTYTWIATSANSWATNSSSRWSPTSGLTLAGPLASDNVVIESTGGLRINGDRASFNLTNISSAGVIFGGADLGTDPNSLTVVNDMTINAGSSLSIRRTNSTNPLNVSVGNNLVVSGTLGVGASNSYTTGPNQFIVQGATTVGSSGRINNILTSLDSRFGDFDVASGGSMVVLEKSVRDIGNISESLSAEVRSLSGGGTIYGSNFELTGTRTATLNIATANTTNASFGGVLQDSEVATTGVNVLNVTMSGNGVQALTGTNTYTGATTVNSGTLLIAGTGSINHSSSVAINAGGNFIYSSSIGLSRNVTLNTGGTFTHNGINPYTGTLTWNSGTLAGANFSGVSLTVGANRTLSPGNSPGIMVTGSQIWENGGNYNLEIYDLDQAAGIGFDTIAITGSLDLTAVTSGGFNINLWSLSAIGPDMDGDALNFNSLSAGSWLIVSTSGGISGFDESKFTINVGAANGTSGFSNDLSGGSFSVSLVGNDLFLNFTPIPEPSAWMLFGLGLATLFFRNRHRRL